MHKHYSNEHSSAEVVINPNLPASVSGVLEVVRVWTDPEARKQGFATELMKSITEDADIEGRVLMLHPKTFGRVGLEDLPPWYERFGFSVIQRHPVVLMARMPVVYSPVFSVIAGAVSELTRG
jgi:predicted GNAT family acetyltransferase